MRSEQINKPDLFLVVFGVLLILLRLFLLLRPFLPPELLLLHFFLSTYPEDFYGTIMRLYSKVWLCRMEGYL